MTVAQAEAAPADFRGLMERGRATRAAGDRGAALDFFQAALAQRPSEAWARLAVADTLRDLGRSDEADEACRAVLADEPDNVAALMALGHSLRGRGDKAAALPLFQAALARKPNEAWARMAVADTLRDLGRSDEADEACRAVLADEPDNVAACMSLGHSLRGRGDKAAALPLFQAALARKPNEAWARLAVADTLRDLGRLDEAEEAWRALLADEPGQIHALVSLGHAAAAKADRHGAVSWFERAVRAAPDAPGPRLALADALRNTGGFGEAAEAAQAVLARDPGHAAAWMSLGQTERRAGRRGAALQAFARASELRPADPKPLVEMAVEERALGRPDASEALLRRALEADAADIDALQQLGEHFRLANRLDAALEMFRRAMASPGQPIWAHLAASQILADLGDADAALRTLEDAGARLGPRPEFVAKRAELTRRAGDWIAARDLVGEATRAWPNHFGLWFERARLEQIHGGPEALLACLDDTPAGTTHERARVHHLRGLAVAEQWRFEEAAGHYARAIELNPDDGWPRICLAQARLLALDTEGAREQLRAVSSLEASASKLQGRSTNISQTHLGQLLDEFTLDQEALADLRALRALAPADRVEPLLDLVRRYPEYTPAAIGLLVALRRSGRLARRPEAPPGASRIPDTVAQYWNDDDLPPDVAGIMGSWGRLYPRFALRRFSDAQARAFLARSHSAEVQAAYRRSRQPAQKADIFRLAYLHSEGGWYADADDRLVGDFDALRAPGAGLVLYQEDFGTIGNNVVGAAPGHPVVGRALRLAVDAINRGDSDLLWLSTGPGLLTRAFADLVARADRPPLAALDDAVVLEFGALQRVVSIHCLAGYKNTERHWSRAAFGRKHSTAAASTDNSSSDAGSRDHCSLNGSAKLRSSASRSASQTEDGGQSQGAHIDSRRLTNMMPETKTSVVNKPRALVISPSGRIYDHDCVKWYDRSQKEIEENYFNIGDMVVFDSTLKMLDFEEAQGMVIQAPPRHEIERYKNFDFIMVRASNFIHNEMEWHDAVRILEEVQLPVYAIGVGGQASGQEKYKLNDANLRFWKLVSERSKLIGVRGTYTADMLYANGIKNVEVCGCPSLFRTRQRDLRISMPAEVRNVAFSIRRETSATYTDDAQGYLAQQRDFLLRVARAYNTTVTIHGEPEEKAFFYGRQDLMAHAEAEFRASGWWTPDTEKELRSLYSDRLFFFLKVSEYDDFIRSQDFAIGYRVHGVLPALANGVPGVLIRYDSRSGELADTLALPSVTAEEALRLEPKDLLESVSFDEFNKMYSARYDKMKFVLEQNGLPHRL